MTFIYFVYKDRYEFNRVRNLWAVMPDTGTTRQLTQDMNISGYGILSNQSRIYFSAYRSYEFLPTENINYDLWLLNPKDVKLSRLTAEKSNLFVTGVSPDGTHLLVSDGTTTLESLSLFDAKRSPIMINFDKNYTFGGAK